MICNKIDACYSSIVNKIKFSACPNDPNKCVMFSDKRSHAKCEENRKKYIINNENEPKSLITLYRVDNGIIVVDNTVPNKTKKCDYLFCINKDNSSAVMVELKGIDVIKAIQQINETCSLYERFLEKFDKVFARIIVTNSSPCLHATPAYALLQKKISQLGGNIKIAERKLVEEIDIL